MITLLRRLSRSFLGKALLMILLAGMAFWGADQGLSAFQQGLGSNLAQAGSRRVEVEALNREIERRIQIANQSSPTPVTREALLQSGEVDRMFETRTLQLGALAYADKLGFEASTAAVAERLNEFEEFKNPLTGAHDPVRYQDMLNKNFFEKAEFEQLISDELVLSKLIGASSGATYPVRLLASIEAQYRAEKRSLSWFMLDTKGAAAPAQPTEAEMLAFYTENLDAIKHPERRIIDVIELSSDDYVHQIEITDQEVATIYEAMKSTRFAGPDTRSFVEMVFPDRQSATAGFGKLSVGTDASAIQGAISSEVRTGLRESVSDDELREAMFGDGKQSGALFGPRETDRGWVVARLLSVQPGAVRPLEEVADTIRTELARERAAALVYEKLTALEASVNAGAAPETIALQAGVPLMTYQAVDAKGVTKDGLPVGALIMVENALDEAFSLRQGEAGTVLPTASNGSAVVAVRKIIPAYTPKLEDVKSDIRTVMIEQRRAEAVKAYAQGFADRIKAGTQTMDAAAKLAGLSN